jgi:uncharacterized protein
MARRTDSFDLAGLRLTSGEGRHLDLEVPLGGFDLGGEAYTGPATTTVRLDISRTTADGYALRLRFSAQLTGPCMRCLTDAEPSYEVDAREVSVPGGGDQVGDRQVGDRDPQASHSDRRPHASHRDLELESPYVADGALDLSGWAHDALALALGPQILCRPDCAGLCPVCGENLNLVGADHHPESGPDPRWAKLSELRFD